MFGNLALKLGRTLAAILFGVVLGSEVSAAHAVDISVFAAASLTDALTEAGAQFEAKTHNHVVFTFGGSATLAKQIENGAPAQIYAGASEDSMDYMSAHHLLEENSDVSPIGNELMLVAPAASEQKPVKLSTKLDIAGMLAGGNLAIGDPDNDPEGKYAKQALSHFGLWNTASDHLARGDNERAALALVEQGAALGVVYKTDAVSSKQVKVIASFPDDSHTPVTYPFAIVKGQRTKEVEAFFAFITGKPGLDIFQKYGFSKN